MIRKNHTITMDWDALASSGLPSLVSEKGIEPTLWGQHQPAGTSHQARNSDTEAAATTVQAILAPTKTTRTQFVSLQDVIAEKEKEAAKKVLDRAQDTIERRIHAQKVARTQALWEKERENWLREMVAPPKSHVEKSSPGNRLMGPPPE